MDQPPLKGCNCDNCRRWVYGPPAASQSEQEAADRRALYEAHRAAYANAGPVPYSTSVGRGTKA